MNLYQATMFMRRFPQTAELIHNGRDIGVTTYDKWYNGRNFWPLGFPVDRLPSWDRPDPMNGFAQKWMVQAHACGLGWVDIGECEDRDAAEQRAEQLIANDSAWMTGTKERRVRIVIAEHRRSIFTGTATEYCELTGK